MAICRHGGASCGAGSAADVSRHYAEVHGEKPRQRKPVTSAQRKMLAGSCWMSLDQLAYSERCEVARTSRKLGATMQPGSLRDSTRRLEKLRYR